MEVKREIEMGDGREGRRAEGQMDGIMRRGIVICYAVQDCQDSSSQIESGNGRQKATDPVQIGLTQSAGGGCEPHSCFGLRYYPPPGLIHGGSNICHRLIPHITLLRARDYALTAFLIKQ
jgi:hypothetical protein